MKDRTCFFCHRTGHLIADCLSLKRKQHAAESKQPKVITLIKTDSLAESTVDPPSDQKISDDCFKPFIFDGWVSLTGKAEDQHPVTVLQDTASSQSLILSGVLPLGADSTYGASAVIRGIEMGYVPAPLHNVHIQTKLITGFVV